MEISKFDILSEITSPLASLTSGLKTVARALEGTDALGRFAFYSIETNAEIETDPRIYLLEALMDINCRDGLKDGQVLRYPGVIEVSDDLWGALIDLNSSKSALRTAVDRCYSAGAKPHNLREAYTHAGYARLHPLLAWRKLVMLEGQVRSVGFTTAKAIDSIERMTLEKALSVLEVGGADVARMIHAEGFSNEASVSWHEPTSPHVRANVVWSGSGPDSETEKKQFHACLPFVVRRGGWPFKRVRWNTPKNKESGNQRADALKGSRFELPFRDGGFLVVMDNQGKEQGLRS